MTGARVLRLGVLGCADIALRRTLPSLERQPLVEVTAVASRRIERAREFSERFGGAAVEGYERLLERDDVDAVYIPLPPALHAEWTLRALAAGKHVWCEKPFATDLAEAEKAVAAARERGLLLMENFMFLHHSQHARVRELVADGLIGEVQLFASEFGIPLQPAADGSGGLRRASTLPEVAAYPLRAAQLFLGPGLRVAGAQVRPASAHGPSPAGSALLESPDGIAAQLSYGVEHAYRSGYELWGSRGRVRLERAFSTPDEYTPVLKVERDGRAEEIALAPDQHFTNTAGVFARTVLQDQDFAPHAEAVLAHARLVEEVQRAAG
ncbi:gfo/Idh/MocA family oxidoreductase [Streptomyces sp. col6]|uniref:Gfo/Idh/MocA family protein n=1 Tax=Streptomyces sp. col6 TaxID=2478958 RepID=UPI0011CD3BF3|nr:Gfo/Idh/MocA family oxidoreductase [Streptomyces sp. col6]TXS05314.1 gfo/Idh/MocA family oxidoreductase [Streptomyces sp. col6]